MGSHLLCTQCTVQSHTQWFCMSNRCIKGLQRLSAEGSSAGISDGAADHYGQCCFFCIAEIFFYCENGCLRIQGIKNCFNEQQIRTTVYQAAHLFIISVGYLIESYSPESGIVDIGIKRKCFVHRTDGGGDVFVGSWQLAVGG